MKNAFINVRNTKQRYLKKYIYYSATKIQSLFRAYRDRKIKVPINRKIKDKKAILEAMALGWKARRILKLKEVQSRIKQIRDFENAEEETLAEAKKSTTLSADEKQKLLDLIEGFRTSRQNTVVKLIKLVHNMEQRSLWVTCSAAEKTDEGLRTPRKGTANPPESFLKRGARTATKEVKTSRDPFLRASMTTSPSKYLD